MTTPIGELDLPARTKGALIRAGFYSLEQLRAVHPAFNFLPLTGIAFKGEQAIMDILGSLPPEDEDAPAAAAAEADESAWPFGPDHPQPMREDEREREITRFLEWLMDEGVVLLAPRLDNGEFVTLGNLACDDTRNTRMTEVQPEDIPHIIGLWKQWEEDRAVADAERRAEGG